jgi:hypothetical protein
MKLFGKTIIIIIALTGCALGIALKWPLSAAQVFPNVFNETKYITFLFSFLTISSAAFAAHYDCAALDNVKGPITLTRMTSDEGTVDETVVFAGRSKEVAVSVRIQEAGGLVIATIEQDKKLVQAIGGFSQISSNKQQIFGMGLSANGATAGPVPTVAINCTKN